VTGTQLLLATGETVEVACSLEEAAKELENATRSSAGALAWFDDGAERIAINPSHVVSIRPGGDESRR
jgi:hypothetical protein